METKPIDRLLAALLVLVVAAGGYFIHRYHQGIGEREERLTGLALLRAQQMLGVRIGAMFEEWEEDLREEAEAVALGLPEEQLLRRWQALLNTHWAVTSIRLADERGSETALHRADSGLVLVRTSGGSKTGPPFAYAVSDAGADGAGSPWEELGAYDPRERIWFSKALEHSREGPVWGERQFGDTAEHVLQVSLLVRSIRPEQPIRVLMLDVDLGRAPALDGANPALLRNGMALLNAEGRVLVANRAASEAPMAMAMAKALAQWQERLPSAAFRVEQGDAVFAAQASPLQLNGLLLHALVTIDTSLLVSWLAPERKALWVAAALLATLALSLGGLALRNRARRRAARLQALQAQQLGHRLAKAIGERDALSREVHHRVKNNLQVVSSLLNLQASALDDNAVRDEFLRGKRRIDTIALVHHRLYDHPDLREIDLRAFLSQLTASIAELSGDRRRTVSLSVDTHGLKCDQDTAIELGIITCELVTNAYQHAFPHATGGHIDVIISNVEGDLHRLVVQNNGVAPDRALLSGPGKLGLEIVEALANQLDGSLHLRTNGLSAFEVLFRMRRESPSADAVGSDGR